MEKTIERLAWLVARLRSKGGFWDNEKANRLETHAYYLSGRFGIDSRVFGFYLNSVR